MLTRLGMAGVFAVAVSAIVWLASRDRGTPLAGTPRAGTPTPPVAVGPAPDTAAPNMTPAPTLPADSVDIPAAPQLTLEPAAAPELERRLAEPVGATEEPFVWPLAVAALLVAGALGWAMVPRREVEVHDSNPFSEALELWAPVVFGRLDVATPRAAKRFLNRVRFHAMQQRRASSAPPSWRSGVRSIWRGRPDEVQGGADDESIPEGALVALSAVHACWADALTSDASFNGVLPEVRGEIQKTGLTAPTDADWQDYNTLYRARFAEYVRRVHFE